MSYRIVCTDQEPVYQPTTHAHIVGVGTGTNPDQADARWTLAQVISAIDRGEVFYTVGRTSGRKALVQVVACGHCRGRIIRSAPDATTDNNLDHLRRCQWRS
jgi:hypothetical protein